VLGGDPSTRGRRCGVELAKRCRWLIASAEVRELVEL
jgi:hypothetical protein